MKNKLSVLAIVLSVIAIASVYMPKESTQTAQKEQAKESTYDRIMRTKTIRCAYQIWPPFFGKDPNTGKMSGLYFDLVERLGKDWGVKIDWAEEVGFSDMFEGLESGRTDMFCSAVTTSPERTNVAVFSKPIAYGPFFLYTREGDTRFDDNYDRLNHQDITMLTLDGYIGSTITKEEFPEAQTLSLPNLTSDVDVLLSLASGKADAAICDPSIAHIFIKNNPGKVRQVRGRPLHNSSFNLAIPSGEDRLKTKLDTTLQYYLDTGIIDKFLAANNIDMSAVFRIAKPYQTGTP